MIYRATGKARKDRTEGIADIFGDILTFGVMLAVAWVGAWIWKPEISSGTVCFVAFIAAAIVILTRNTIKETR